MFSKERKKISIKIFQYKDQIARVEFIFYFLELVYLKKMLPTGQHTLITQPDNDGHFKHCILVKLTESCTQAIEDYLKIKVIKH